MLSLFIQQFHVGDNKKEYEIIPDSYSIIGSFKQSAIDKYGIYEDGSFSYPENNDELEKILSEAIDRTLEMFENHEESEEVQEGTEEFRKLALQYYSQGGSEKIEGISKITKPYDNSSYYSINTRHSQKRIDMK